MKTSWYDTPLRVLATRLALSTMQKGATSLGQLESCILDVDGVDL